MAAHRQTVEEFIPARGRLLSCLPRTAAKVAGAASKAGTTASRPPTILSLGRFNSVVVLIARRAALEAANLFHRTQSAAVRVRVGVAICLCAILFCAGQS